MQLVVGQCAPEGATRRRQRIEELVFGILHCEIFVHSAQAPFVETGVMRHKRQTLNAGSNLRPHLRKLLCRAGIAVAKSVHTLAEIGVIVGHGANERVETIDHLAITHHDHTHRADAGARTVCGFEIYCCEISHNSAKIQNFGIPQLPARTLHTKKSRRHASTDGILILYIRHSISSRRSAPARGR